MRAARTPTECEQYRILFTYPQFFCFIIIIIVVVGDFFSLFIRSFMFQFYHSASVYTRYKQNNNWAVNVKTVGNEFSDVALCFHSFSFCFSFWSCFFCSFSLFCDCYLRVVGVKMAGAELCSLDRRKANSRKWKNCLGFRAVFRCKIYDCQHTQTHTTNSLLGKWNGQNHFVRRCTLVTSDKAITGHMLCFSRSPSLCRNS